MHLNASLISAGWLAFTCGMTFAAEAIPPVVMVRAAPEFSSHGDIPVRVFTDRNGMTLYVADSDRTPNASNCYDNCGHNWPAFNASDNDHNTGDWTVILREDGTKQWAYKGKPVYRFILDRAPGDVKGNGIGNVWHLFGP